MTVYIVWTAETFASKHSLIVHHHCWSVLWKTALKGHTVKVQLFTECPDNILWTIYCFVAKLFMVMHHHEPECHVKIVFPIFKVRVTVRAHIIKIWLCLLYFLEHLNFLQRNMSCCGLWKDWNTVLGWVGEFKLVLLFEIIKLIFC